MHMYAKYIFSVSVNIGKENLAKLIFVNNFSPAKIFPFYGIWDKQLIVHLGGEISIAIKPSIIRQKLCCR